ncbi:MAG: phosphoribosylglycinamide formyltransferase [Acidimicrobiales bacterium]
MARLGVLASGAGSNLAAILDSGLAVELVVVDRPCGATDVAKAAGVPARVVRRESFGPDFDREAYTLQVVDALRQAAVEVVAMAGFGTILGPTMHDAFPGRVLNTHPALLPAFPGWHAVEAALAAGVTVTGCTIHVAVPEVDAGPILAQEPVPVLAGDTPDTLHERIKAVEHRLYPETISRFLEGVEERPAPAPERSRR